MDANDTRFHMVTGRADWAPILDPAAARTDVVWEEETKSIALARRLFRFKRAPQDVPPQLERRRGAARDRYGNWYWIAASGDEIRVQWEGSEFSEVFWSAEMMAAAGACKPAHPRYRTGAGTTPRREDSDVSPPGAFAPSDTGEVAATPMRGLAVTEEHYLVAGTRRPASLIIFDLHAGGPPLYVEWPSQIAFRPVDMAAAPGGGLYVLDAPVSFEGEAAGDGDEERTGETEARYWVLDRTFRVVAVDEDSIALDPPHTFDFEPVGGEREALSGRRFPAPISLDLASPLQPAAPIAIDSLPDGSVLVLGTGEVGSVIYRYRGGRLLGSVDLTDVFVGLVEGDETSLKGFDFAFLPGPESEASLGTLYIAATDGNQAFAFTVKDGKPPDAGDTEESSGLALKVQERYLPMRNFGGRGLVGALTATGEGVVYYDRSERLPGAGADDEAPSVHWVPLAAKPRPRYRSSGIVSAGDAALSEPSAPKLVFDGKERGCTWHRILLDARIPAGAHVRIESRAADDPEALAALPWQGEPEPYLRPTGAEIPYYRPFGDDQTGAAGTGTWESLLQQATGRYLQLRLTLSGTGRNTPRIRALRVYYPRFSYLDEYLPDIYQEDPTSASFLERFLANPEGVFTAIEDRIAQSQFLLDVRTAPAEALEWLAGWQGAMLDPAWDERRKRLFVAHAPQLFAERGTAAGVMRAVRLATDPCPDDSIFTEAVDPTGGGKNRPWGVRIVERFLTRRSPGVVFGDPTEIEGPGVTSPDTPWRPGQGAAPLHRRYGAFLEERYGSDVSALNLAWQTSYGSFGDIDMPPTAPLEGSRRQDWLLFVAGPIGFTYAPVEAEDKEVYARFLALRYRSADALSAADPFYANQEWTDFGGVKLPQALPAGGRALYDWIQFTSVYLPTTERAHRFTVLVPVFGESVPVPDDAAGGASRGVYGPDPEVVRRVVELEKPAHTVFDVKPYWALFRVGEARLGIDSQPGRSSRLGAAVVGRSVLGEGYLAYTHPWNVAGRRVVGRDRVADGQEDGGRIWR